MLLPVVDRHIREIDEQPFVSIEDIRTPRTHGRESWRHHARPSSPSTREPGRLVLARRLSRERSRESLAADRRPPPMNRRPIYGAGDACVCEAFDTCACASSCVAS